MLVFKVEPSFIYRFSDLLPLFSIHAKFDLFLDFFPDKEILLEILPFHDYLLFSVSFQSAPSLDQLLTTKRCY